MSNTLTITHLAVRRPERNRIVVVPLVCRDEENGNYFARGLKSDHIAPDDLAAQVVGGHVIELTEPLRIRLDQAVFLMPSGKLFLAKMLLGPTDPQKVPLAIHDRRGESEYERLLRFSWLTEFGVKTRELLASDLPRTFATAFDRLEVALNSQPDLRKCCAAQVYYSMRGIKYAEHIDKGLFALTRGLQTSLIGFTLDEVRPKPHWDTSWDLLVKYEFERFPVILLFPFFWTRDLHPNYGVIPYGLQVQIGLLVSRDHPAFQYDIEDHYKYGMELERDWVVNSLLAPEQKEWRGGKVWACRGYRFGHIASEMAAAVSPEAHRRLVERRGYIEQSQQIEKVSDARSGSMSGGTTVLLLDPGEKQHIAELCPKEDAGLAYLTVRHGIDVPVGIGFSLAALPMLLRDGNWRTLIRTADAVFANMNVSDLSALADAGIELNKEVLLGAAEKIEKAALLA